MDQTKITRMEINRYSYWTTLFVVVRALLCRCNHFSSFSRWRQIESESEQKLETRWPQGLTRSDCSRR